MFQRVQQGGRGSLRFPMVLGVTVCLDMKPRNKNFKVGLQGEVEHSSNYSVIIMLETTAVIS